MYQLMGGQWSSRRISVTCIKPDDENTFSSRTYDVETDDDLKDEIAHTLCVTPDMLVTRQNPLNGLRFFYAAADGQVNEVAQGLMRKGDKNAGAPVIRGHCYVCKNYRESDPFSSCLPRDIEIITGRSRMFGTERKEQEAAEPVLQQPEEPAKQPAEPAKQPAEPVQETHTKEEEEAKEEEEEEEKSACVVVSPGVAPAATAMTVVLDPLPASLAALRDEVYCQILLNGIKDASAAAAKTQQPADDVQQEEEEEEQEPVTMTKKPKKRARQRRNDVCADNIIPDGLRRSARLRK
jgi:hypothetical protein